jgi:hypothetical protein
VRLLQQTVGMTPFRGAVAIVIALAALTAVVVALTLGLD